MLFQDCNMQHQPVKDLFLVFRILLSMEKPVYIRHHAGFILKNMTVEKVIFGLVQKSSIWLPG
ncbi:hypothetical protein BZK42_25815 [Citrobacter braakii]|uniref:Uncharacterized protein n=1 Tax=Citrobacter braakii TaxID=57706 RepID=A0A1V8NS45_CITBR|nr:hypothetical protein [Salmonella enterica subsp. enterica serovar Coeln]OQM39233.1 hypothetical protein BZK42_25815 [Citrobacter braakii]